MKIRSASRVAALIALCVSPSWAQEPSGEGEASSSESGDSSVDSDESADDGSTDEAATDESQEDAEEQGGSEHSDQEADSEPAASEPQAEEAAAPCPDVKAEALAKYGVPFDAKPWEDLGDTTEDWLKTSSGEWLKGEIKEMREEVLVIDSDEFDLQSIDWPDVEEIHTPNAYDFVTFDQTVASGPADMAEGKLVVHTADGDVIFDAKQILSVTSSAKKEIQHWYYKLSLGATNRRGNTQSVDYSAFSRLRREDAFNRATLDYNGAYGLVSDEVNTNRHRGDLTWNLFVSPVFYVTPFWGMLQYDEFQNIELRSLAAAGGGIHIINTSDLEFDFDLVAGYVATRYISVDTTVNNKVDDGLLVVPALTIDWDITDDIEFEGSWQSSLIVTNIGKSFHHATARLEIEITDVFDLEVSAIYDRQESPVADENGDTPVKDDLATTVGVALEFE